MPTADSASSLLFELGVASAHISLSLDNFRIFFEHTQFRLSHQAIHGRIVREKIPNYRANKVSRVNFDRRNAVQRASESLEFNVEAIVSK